MGGLFARFLGKLACDFPDRKPPSRPALFGRISGTDGHTCAPPSPMVDKVTRSGCVRRLRNLPLRAMHQPRVLVDPKPELSPKRGTGATSGAGSARGFHSRRFGPSKRILNGLRRPARQRLLAGWYQLESEGLASLHAEIVSALMSRQGRLWRPRYPSPP